MIERLADRLPGVEDLHRYPALVHARDYASLWLVRFDEASNEQNTLMFAFIGFNTFATALNAYGLESYFVPILVAFVAFEVVFMWSYDRFEFMREKSQRKSIRKSNYVSPTAVISHVVRAQQIERAVELLNEHADPDGKIEAQTFETLSEVFRGIDISELDTYDFDATES